MHSKYGIILSLMLALVACNGAEPVARMDGMTPMHAGGGKPSVPIVVNVSHTAQDGQVTVVAKAKVMADIHQATFDIMHPDEVDLVSGSAGWLGDVKKGEEITLTATYKIARPVVVYPLSWRALFSSQMAGATMAMHGYTHYGNAAMLKGVTVDGPEVRAGSLEFKGQ